MLESLRELKSISTRLNEASDSLTSLLTQINDKLNELNLGLTIWVSQPLTRKNVSPLPGFRDAYGAEELQRLGYTKLKDAWGLAVKEVTMVHGYYQGDDSCPYAEEIEGETKSLLSCSRDIRVGSIELLPELFDQLKKRSEEAIESLETAKKILAEL